jgi:hypothetical protein
MGGRRLRTSVLATACVGTLVLTGCAETVNGTPTAASGGGAFPTTASALFTLINNAARTTKTARLSLHESLAGVQVTGTGDEELANGKATSLDLSEDIPSAGTIRLIILDSTIYVQLPPSLRSGSKPWILASPSSSNPVIAQLYTTLQQSMQSGSFTSITQYLQGASTVHLLGTPTMNGERVGHYKVTVDVTKLPADFPDRQTMIAAGVSKIPVELWVDAQGRPAEVSENVTVDGQTVQANVQLSNYNVPVHISAPPANQVGH